MGVAILEWYLALPNLHEYTYTGLERTVEGCSYSSFVKVVLESIIKQGRKKIRMNTIDTRCTHSNVDGP